VCVLGVTVQVHPIRLHLKEVLIDRIKPLGVPTLYGMSFVHIDQNLTFPSGPKATLNTTTMSIILEGP
jgi:muramoyltetrapeptide carboxypeptidase